MCANNKESGPCSNTLWKLVGFILFELKVNAKKNVISHVFNTKLPSQFVSVNNNEARVLYFSVF